MKILIGITLTGSNNSGQMIIFALPQSGVLFHCKTRYTHEIHCFHSC